MNKYLRALLFILKTRSLPKYRDGKFYGTVLKRGEKVMHPARVTNYCVKIAVPPRTHPVLKSWLESLRVSYTITLYDSIIDVGGYGDTEFQFNWSPDDNDGQGWWNLIEWAKSHEIEGFNYTVTTTDELSRQIFWTEDVEL